MLSELVFESRKPMGFDVCQQSDEIKHVWFFRHAYIVHYPMGGGGFCHFIATVMGTLCIFGQKNGQVGGGVQSSSNFSPSVAITFISSQCILGCTESNVSQKKQTSISQIPWWLEQQGYLQVHRISHWLCWCDSGIWGWLTFAAAHKVVLAALSPQRRTVTHFLRGWVPPVIRKVKVLCYRLTYYNCQICFVESEKLLPKWYLKSSSCCPFFLAKNIQCARGGASIPDLYTGIHAL